MKRYDFVVMAVLFVACGDMNQAPTDFTPAADRLATAGNDELPPLTMAAAPATRASAATTTPPANPRSVLLSPLGASGLRAAARLTPHGAMTAVAIALEGGASSASYRGELREGSCALLAARVSTLIDVTADVAGRGRSVTYVAVPLDSLTSVPHVVVYGPGGRPETCGPVGGREADGGDGSPTPSPTSPPPASPEP